MGWIAPSAHVASATRRVMTHGSALCAPIALAKDMTDGSAPSAYATSATTRVMTNGSVQLPNAMSVTNSVMIHGSATMSFASFARAKDTTTWNATIA